MATPEPAHEVRGQRREVRRPADRHDASCLQPREVEQRVDQLEQPPRVAIHGLELTATKLPVRKRECILDRAEHQRQRRAELLADVAEERSLHAIDLGERFGALLLGIERRGNGERGPDVARDQLEEPVVRRVPRATRARARDQDPGDAPAIGGQDRDHHRGRARLGPWPTRKRPDERRHHRRDSGLQHGDQGPPR